MNSDDQNKFFHKGEFRVEYNHWGSGKRTILALHGFGRTLDDFRAFTHPLEDRFTVYAVNIFYHGNSEITNRDPEKNPLSPEEFAAFFNSFFDHILCEKLSIIGYSLGGRLGMKITELLPNRVDGLYLFAPDGLTKSRWYVLLSHYLIGRWVFKFLIRNTKQYNQLLNSFVKAGFISSNLEKFIRSQTGTEEKKQKVFNVWTALRKIEPNFKELRKSVESNRLPFKIIIGSFDNIIPIKNARKAKRKIPSAEIILIRSGHKMLTEEIGKEIEQHLD